MAPDIALGPMPSLHQQRCFNHAEREAVARCPACERFFCRECITEHEGRVVCAGCLTQQAAGAGRRAGWWRRRMLRSAAFVGGLTLAWGFFYLLARLLLRLPPAVHEGTFWRQMMG